MAIGTGTALLLGAGASAAASVVGANKASKAVTSAAKNETELQKAIYEDTKERFAPVYEGGMNAFDAILYEMGLGPRPTFGGEDTYTIEEVQRAGGGGPQTTLDRFGKIVTLEDGPSVGYRVGDQEFDTQDAAQAWIDQQPQQGGTPYQGYMESPMAKYLLERGMEGIEGGAAAAGGLYSGATLEALENNRRQVIEADTGDYYNRLFNLAGMGTNAAGNMGSAGQFYAANAGSAMRNAANAQAMGYQNMAQGIQGGIMDAAGIYGYMNPMQSYAASSMAPMQPPRPMARPF